MPVTFMSFGEMNCRFAAALALLDLADADQDVGLELVELRLRHLAELDLHLRREQALAQHGVVVHLRLDRRHDLVEDEAHAGDDQASR